MTLPIFWRYLLGRYLKVFLLALISFIAILIVSRLEEIASVAALGANAWILTAFTLLQIPYLLPIAIPICCLISSMVLFQNLSSTQELTSLRASGLSFRQIISPLLIISLFLSFANFCLASEVATRAHLTTRQLIHRLTSLNPLLLLENAKIAKLDGAYIQMAPIDHGKHAKDVLIAVKNAGAHRLNLLIVDQLKIKKSHLIGENVTIISGAPSSSPEDFDHLVIENQKESKTLSLDFAKLFARKGWKVANDHLKLSLLSLRIQELKKQTSHQANKKALTKCYSEIVSRISLGFAPFAFTMLGLSSGINISRRETKKGLLTALALAFFSLICFFAAKELSSLFSVATTLFILPPLILILFSIFRLKAIGQGIE